MRSRSRPEWLDGADEDVLPAVSTSSLAFQAVLDDLVRAVDAPALAPTAPAPVPAPTPAPTPTDSAPKGTLWSSNGRNESNYVHFGGDGAGVDAVGAVGAVGAASAGPPPARLRGRGDLTLVVGLGAEAHEAASVLAASADAGAEVHRVTDRRDALAVRADGVRREIPVVAAFPLPGPQAVPELAVELAGIAPDQVWVVVDVSRKLDDTAEWVRAVDAVLAVDAVAATGASLTGSPGSVHALGLPVLWLEAPPGG